MRTAYLIKDNGAKAELVTHGNVVDLKKKFLSVELKKDETLLLLGTDIRPKRRGINDEDAYFALVAKENEKINAASKLKADALRKAKPIDGDALKAAQAKLAAEQAESAKKADERKSGEVAKIKAEQAAKHQQFESTTKKSEKKELTKNEK